MDTIHKDVDRNKPGTGCRFFQDGTIIADPLDDAVDGRKRGIFPDMFDETSF
jgi:hypothetical protein